MEINEFDIGFCPDLTLIPRCRYKNTEAKLLKIGYLINRNMKKKTSHNAHVSFIPIERVGVEEF